MFLRACRGGCLALKVLGRWGVMKPHFGKGPWIAAVHILYLPGCVGKAAHIWEAKYPWEQDVLVLQRKTESQGVLSYSGFRIFSLGSYKNGRFSDSVLNLET